jgi:hypothetical protein
MKGEVIELNGRCSGGGSMGRHAEHIIGMSAAGRKIRTFAKLSRKDQHFKK